MNITTTGRHRQSAWLGFRPVAVLLALLALLILLTACSGTEAEPAADTETAQPPVVTAEPEPIETVTGAPAPEPEPTIMSLEEAADRYLEIIGPSNAAATEAIALLDVERYSEACEVMIAPDTKSLDKFAAEQWPGDVDRLIKDQLIPLTEDEIDAYTSCANASSDSRAEDIYWSDVYAAQEARSAISSAVRTLLNLPQVN